MALIVGRFLRYRSYADDSEGVKPAQLSAVTLSRDTMLGQQSFM